MDGPRCRSHTTGHPDLSKPEQPISCPSISCLATHQCRRRCRQPHTIQPRFAMIVATECNGVGNAVQGRPKPRRHRCRELSTIGLPQPSNIVCNIITTTACHTADAPNAAASSVQSPDPCHSRIASSSNDVILCSAARWRWTGGLTSARARSPASTRAVASRTRQHRSQCVTGPVVR